MVESPSHRVFFERGIVVGALSPLLWKASSFLFERRGRFKIKRCYIRHSSLLHAAIVRLLSATFRCKKQLGSRGEQFIRGVLVEPANNHHLPDATMAGILVNDLGQVGVDLLLVDVLVGKSLTHALVGGLDTTPWLRDGSSIV